MPRKRSPVAIAAGKLILAIQNECGELVGEADAGLAQQVMDRAHRLLQAAHLAAVASLLDGRSIAEYLDPVWVEMHPAVKPSVETLAAALNKHENA